MVISNTGIPSMNIYYAANPPPQTYYTLQMTAFSSRSTWAGGPLFLRQNPTNATLGDFTLGQAAGGSYTVASDLNANLQGSTDNVNYFNASGALQLVPSQPLAIPKSIIATLSGGNVILNWNGSFNLQRTASLSPASWSNVSGGPISGPYTNVIHGSQQFFRLSQ